MKLGNQTRLFKHLYCLNDLELLEGEKEFRHIDYILISKQSRFVQKSSLFTRRKTLLKNCTVCRFQSIMLQQMIEEQEQESDSRPCLYTWQCIHFLHSPNKSVCFITAFASICTFVYSHYFCPLVEPEMSRGLCQSAQANAWTCMQL